MLQTSKAFDRHRDTLNKYRFMLIFDKFLIKWTCSKHFMSAITHEIKGCC